MKYQKRYLATHDIDWFCKINNIYIHVASAGGVLPEIVDNSEVNRKIQRIVDELPVLDDEVIITPLIHNVNSINYENEDCENDYVKSFKEMASKGFYSFDRVDINNIDSNNYHLVAYPNYENNNLGNIFLDADIYIPKIERKLDMGFIKEGKEINLIELINML